VVRRSGPHQNEQIGSGTRPLHRGRRREKNSGRKAPCQFPSITHAAEVGFFRPWLVPRRCFVFHSALQRPKEAANDKDVRIGCGVATLQQYLRARLIYELHLAFRPILMGSGENLFAGFDLAALGYRCAENISTEHAMHVVLTKQT
jgi:dihydrofolate reductase